MTTAAAAPVAEFCNLAALPMIPQTRPPEIPQLEIDREAGRILNIAVARIGTAAGHEYHADAEFLASVAAEANTDSDGLKSRFGHPDPFGPDPIGSTVGAFSNFRFVATGGLLLADLSLYPSAHALPRLSGADVYEYLLAHAAEAPRKFGVSLSFRHDTGAEAAFMGSHLDPDGNFVSPDPENPANLPHFRFSELIAADFVDRPSLSTKTGLLSGAPKITTLPNPAGPPATEPKKGEQRKMEDLSNLSADDLATGNPGLVRDLRAAGAAEAMKTERGRAALILTTAAELAARCNPTPLFAKAAELIANGTEARLSADGKPTGDGIGELKLLSADLIAAGNTPPTGSNATANVAGAPANLADPKVDNGRSRLEAARALQAQTPGLSIEAALSRLG